MECDFEARARSGEEEAELQRSTKKVKEDLTSGPSQTSLEQGRGASNTMSFKAKLVGDIPGAFAQAFKFSADDDEEPFSDEEVDDPPEGTVAIQLSKRTKMNIRAKWAHSLIVKVFGRKVGFHFLHSRIMQLWKPAGRLDCIDLENDFYLCKFGLVEDFEKVLKGGPWFVGEHYLTIRAWEPYFKPNVAACSKVAVWARLPGLPIELYEMEVLKEIGKAIGPVLRVDANTAAGTRGRYARLCLQVDLEMPLPRFVLIGRFRQAILYEGIGSLCFSCGRMGHQKPLCPYTVKDTVVETDNGGENIQNNNVEVGIEEPSNPVGDLAGTDSEVYGPWMLVERRKHVSKSRASRALHLKSNPEQISAFNAKDLGRLRRLTSEANLPTKPPTASPEGKRKNRRFDNTSQLDPTTSHLPNPTATEAGLGALPSASSRPSVLTGNEPVNGQTSHLSNFPKTETHILNPKVNQKLKPKASETLASHGRQHSKAVGNKSTRKNHASFHVSHSPDSSFSHHDLGVVRPGADASLESHFSSNSRKPKAGISSSDRPGLASMGQPLVEISVGHPNRGGGEDNGVESTLANFSRSSLARIKPSGGGPNKENNGGWTNSNKFSGVFGSHQGDTSMWELSTDEPTDHFEGATSGDYGTCNMHLEEHGVVEVQAKGAELELAEPGKEPVSNQ